MAEFYSDKPVRWTKTESGFGQTTIGKGIKAVTDEVVDSETGQLKEPYDSLHIVLKVLRITKTALIRSQLGVNVYAQLLSGAAEAVEALILDYLGLDLYAFVMQPSPLKFNPLIFDTMAVHTDAKIQHRRDREAVGLRVENEINDLNDLDDDLVFVGYRDKTGPEKLATGTGTKVGVEFGRAPDGTLFIEPFPWEKCLSQMEMSLQDETDPDRPTFSANSNVCGMVLAIGLDVPVYNILHVYEAWKKLMDGIQNISFDVFKEKLDAIEADNWRERRTGRDSSWEGIPPNWERLGKHGWPTLKGYMDDFTDTITAWAGASKFKTLIDELATQSNNIIQTLIDSIDLIHEVLTALEAIVLALASLEGLNFYRLMIPPESEPTYSIPSAAGAKQYGGMDRFMGRMREDGDSFPKEKLVFAVCLLTFDPVSTASETLVNQWRALTEFTGFSDAYDEWKAEVGLVTTDAPAHNEA